MQQTSHLSIPPSEENVQHSCWLFMSSCAFHKAHNTHIKTPSLQRVEEREDRNIRQKKKEAEQIQPTC